jgi:hypothetical protein
MMRLSHLIRSAVPVLVLAGCSIGQPPPPPTPEPFTALYLVKNGPYPLYAVDGEWLANRVGGLPLAQADDLTMRARRVAQVQNRISPTDEPWLHSGCIFDVQRTRPDQQDASYVWAYGQVFRCDDLIETGIPEPEMGVRPHELRIYDGSLGYFPMSLLEPYTGAPPAPHT